MSPINENPNKKEKYNPFETDKEKVIKIEFLTINDRPYFGQILDEELMFVWVEVLKKVRIFYLESNQPNRSTDTSGPSLN